ncbi:MAG: HAD-IB family phosphatase [Bacteroidota bacterium]
MVLKVNTVKTLVLFDFDGTITKKDTFPLFFKYSFGNFKYAFGFFIHIPMYILHKVKIISAKRFKISILSLFLKHKKREWIEDSGERFISFLHADKIIKTDLIDKILFYKNEQYTIYIVSASLDIWIKPFCQKYGINYICTEIKYSDDIFLGELNTNNCNYEEKKKRVSQNINISDFDKIIVYGDSNGDKKMMELATEQHWIR